jgi:hypothetical protein
MKSEKIIGGILVAWILFGILWIAIVGAGIWAAIHFISKYW